MNILTNRTNITPAKLTGFMLVSLLLVTLLLNASSCFGKTTTTQVIVNGVVYSESSSGAIKGSGKSAESRRNVGDFQRISHHILAQVNYRQDKTVSVVISGDDNILPLIMTEVSAGELVISTTKSFVTQLPIVIELSSPHLGVFSVQGSGNISATGIQEPNFKLDLSGSGTAVVAGIVGSLNVSVSGSGDVDAENLVCKLAHVRISGSGGVILTATEALNARVTGSGSIHYFGNPKAVDKQILGSGKIVAGD